VMGSSREILAQQYRRLQLLNACCDAPSLDKLR
jgi:hypothetical protein